MATDLLAIGSKMKSGGFVIGVGQIGSSSVHKGLIMAQICPAALIQRVMHLQRLRPVCNQSLSRPDPHSCMQPLTLNPCVFLSPTVDATTAKSARQQRDRCTMGLFLSVGHAVRCSGRSFSGKCPGKGLASR